MLYVGLDIHSKHITICVLDCSGNVFARSQVATVDQMTTFLKQLPDKFSVCYEVSCGYGHYYDLLAPLAVRVLPAHPGRLQLIFRSKRKNDRKDAADLAKLLLLGMVPTVHVPSEAVRTWRELITFRRKLVEKRTRAKNVLRALLRSVGIQAPSRPGLWTKKGMEWLKRLSFSHFGQGLKRDMLVDDIERLCSQITRVEKGLKQFSRNSAAVSQLRSIPGVGLRTAEAVAAYLDDPRRFARSKQVGAYFGLVPSQDQSGEKNKLGHITQQGSATVRQLITEAAWSSIRRSPTTKAYFERIQRGDKNRKKIAVVATAHYLLRVMWSMLKSSSPWRESVDSSSAAALPWDPEAGSQARPEVPAAPHPGQTRRSRKRVGAPV